MNRALRLLLNVLAALFATVFYNNDVARADGCNIADVLFGKVRIEIIYNKQYDYETGIIFGNDFDNERFREGKILGKIEQWGTAGSTSRRIENVNADLCGVLQTDLSISTTDADCSGCSKEPFKLRKVSQNSYVVLLNGGQIVGTIEGRLPKY